MIGLKFSLLRLGGEEEGYENAVAEALCRNYMSKNDKKFDFKSEITYLTVVILS